MRRHITVGQKIRKTIFDFTEFSIFWEYGKYNFQKKNCKTKFTIWFHELFFGYGIFKKKIGGPHHVEYYHESWSLTSCIHVMLPALPRNCYCQRRIAAYLTVEYNFYFCRFSRISYPVAFCGMPWPRKIEQCSNGLLGI